MNHKVFFVSTKQSSGMCFETFSLCVDTGKNIEIWSRFSNNSISQKWTESRLEWCQCRTIIATFFALENKYLMNWNRIVCHVCYSHFGIYNHHTLINVIIIMKTIQNCTGAVHSLSLSHAMDCEFVFHTSNRYTGAFGLAVGIKKIDWVIILQMLLIPLSRDSK